MESNPTTAWSRPVWLLSAFNAQRLFPLLSVVVGILAAALLLAFFVRTVASLTAEVGDYDAYYSAASALRQGQPLYHRALAWRDASWANNYPGVKPIEGQPYPYPPALALAFIPLTFLPIELGIVMWMTVLFGSLIGTAYVLIRMLTPVRGWYHVPAVLGLSGLMALFQPVRASLTSAQVDSVLLFVLALSMWAFVTRHEFRAGICLALAVTVKPFLGFLVLFFLWKRAYRALGLTVALSGFLLGLPLLFLGVGTLLDLIAVSLYYSSPGYATDPTNQSIYGFMLRLFTANAYTTPVIEAPTLVTLVRIAVSVAVVVALARSVSRSREIPASRLALEFGLFIASMLVVSPLTEDIHYTYLIIPFAAAASMLLTTSRFRPMPVALAAALGSIYVYLCIPGLRTIHMAFYSHYDAPLTGLKLWLTGTHLYGLLAVALVMYAMTHWPRRSSPWHPDPLATTGAGPALRTPEDVQ